MFNKITTAMDWEAAPGHEPTWNEIVIELMSFRIDQNTQEIEKFLLSILDFEGDLQLNDSHEMPHSLSPEHMLKFLVIQIIAKISGNIHLETIQKFGASASPALACRVNGVVEKIRTGKI